MGRRKRPLAATLLSLGGSAVARESRAPVVRIAELEIDPAHLEGFKASVKEEMETSVRVEPGVLAIYAVAEKNNPASSGSSRFIPTRPRSGRTSSRRISGNIVRSQRP